MVYHRIAFQGVNKGFIDFKRVNLQIVEVAEAGIADAKIVDINRITLFAISL